MLPLLASEVGEAPAPGELREALVAALGDPGIDVVYPRSDSEQLIDANGRRAALAIDGRAVARITRVGYDANDVPRHGVQAAGAPRSGT